MADSIRIKSSLLFLGMDHIWLSQFVQKQINSETKHCSVAFEMHISSALALFETISFVKQKKDKMCLNVTHSINLFSVELLYKINLINFAITVTC